MTDGSQQPTPSREPSHRRRVLIVDDHVVVRQGLAGLIEQEENLVVCGDVGSAVAALDAIERLQPDVTLVDISLGVTDGLSLVRDVHSRWPDRYMLVLSMHSEAVYALRCLRAGARGYVMKEVGWHAILEAIRAVLAGELYVSEKIGAQLLQHAAEGRALDQDASALSDRELSVFRLVGEGRSTREIAEALGVSHKTVETYRERIKGKLGLASGNELMQRAVAWLKEDRG